jgi:SPP1 gp7 family putative phage head morphogenesis protein
MGVAYVKGYQRGIRAIKDKLGKLFTKRDRMNQHSAERGKFQQVAKAAGYSDSKIARIRGAMTTAARKALRKAAAGVKADVAKARARASADGMNLGDSTKLVNKTIRNAGTSTNNPYHLETIYRTQINMEFNAGIWDASQSLIAEGKVWGFEYVTMGDDKVRPEHELLEGTKLPFGHPLWDVIWPPNGWNCRCSILQIFADEPAARVRRPRKMPDIPDEFRFEPGTVFPKPNAA